MEDINAVAVQEQCQGCKEDSRRDHRCMSNAFVVCLSFLLLNEGGDGGEANAGGNETKKQGKQREGRGRITYCAETYYSRLKDTERVGRLTKGEREEPNCSVICEQRVIPRYPKNSPTTYKGINEERRKARGAAKLKYLFANSKLRAGSESSSHCVVLKNVALDEGVRSYNINGYKRKQSKERNNVRGG